MMGKDVESEKYEWEQRAKLTDFVAALVVFVFAFSDKPV